MNRTGKFIKNTITTAIMQFVVMICGFVVPKIIIQFYGSEINGLVTSISSFISYFTLVEAGLSSAAVYSLYKHLANDDYYEINRIVSATKKFYFKAGYLFLGLVFALAFLYPILIETKILSSVEIFALVFVLGAKGVFDFFAMAKYSVILTADQKSYVISLATICYHVLSTLIILILSIMGASIVMVKAVAILAIFVRSVILYTYCKKKYSYLNYNEAPNNKALNKRWDALYLQILGTIHVGAPTVIITIILTLTDVSIYSMYYLVVTGINSILGIFTAGLSASFGDVIARGQEETLKSTHNIFEYVYYLIITIVYSTAFVTINSFISTYTFGSDIQYVHSFVGFLIVLNGFFYNLKTPQGMLVISAGMYKETRKQTTLQGLIGIILGSFFCFFWGIEGLLVGFILSNLYRDIDLLFFVPKHITKNKVFYTLKKWGLVAVSFSIILILSVFLYVEQIYSYWEWILYAFKIFVISTIVVSIVFVFLDFRDFKLTLEKVKRMMRK